MILLYTSTLPVSQRQTQQLMSSEIRSRIEYLIQTQYSYAHFTPKIYEKSGLNDDFNSL